MMSWTNKHSISILSFVLFNPRCTTHTHEHTREHLAVFLLSGVSANLITQRWSRNKQVQSQEFQGSVFRARSLALSLARSLSDSPPLWVCVCVSLRVCVSMHVNLKGHTDNVGLIWQSSGAVDQRQVWRMTLTVLDHSTSSTGSRKKRKKYFVLIYFFILFTEHHTLWLH